MPRQSRRKEIVDEVLRKHKKADNRTLARLLHEQYPHEFPDPESARNTIRYYRGAFGDKNRKAVKTKEHVQPLRKNKGISLPKGIKESPPKKRFNDVGRWLILGDIHSPYHDEQAIEVAIRHGVDHGCTHLCLNGDIFDFYKFSRWTQNPKQRDPDAELKIGGEVMEYIASHFQGRKVFKVGNHEERYEAYLFSRAPALVGIEDFELDKVLRLKQRGFDYVKSRQFYTLGKLPVFHGHELPRGLTDPVNVARGVYNRLRESAIVNHWHRTSNHVDTTGMKTRTTVCYSNGCLCDLQPNYAPVNGWNLGFAEVEIGQGGNWDLSTYIVERGKAYTVG